MRQYDFNKKQQLNNTTLSDMHPVKYFIHSWGCLYLSKKKKTPNNKISDGMYKHRT